ncbi:hypothetical protein CHGG_03348 [Chaetomium globosum CBS 148.51]|uniref:Prolyl 4-hydroxylase alpha subunit domain-containing protein n=1 Tax=Chaetomium globosum (strain ATCC 6205 / CBS 148.51 / DSM 1962 / NBRC 6347 / NRRL 1970) TaxID=306901 RepID=Q2H8V6_CHAGB|nr:uncharacterized protein CHGG_03348 [Chaetomium globosum CBS 148.51]EAQ91413.1 hypothetical protein CHGG_03348 [Chaetomium globosum CBS 148.51]
MFNYLLALIPILLFFANPISQLFAPSTPRIHRLPRPQLNEDLLALEEPSNYTCPPHPYIVHVVSRAPLVLYIEDFLSLEERRHLLEISTPLYTPSTITHNAGQSLSHTPSVRDSEVALVPRTDAVRCIEERARAVQGWRREAWIERLRVQRYGVGGHYAHHFDWSSGRGGWGRCASGEEHRGGKGGEDDGKKGVVFRVAPGNAVYWENFMADGSGRGYEETWHAGLPVIKGVKVGLNIWTWGRIE